MSASLLTVLLLVAGCAAPGDTETALGPPVPAASVPPVSLDDPPAATSPTIDEARYAVQSANVTAPPDTTPDHLTDPAPQSAPPTTVVVLVQQSAPVSPDPVPAPAPEPPAEQPVAPAEAAPEEAAPEPPPEQPPPTTAAPEPAPTTTTTAAPPPTTTAPPVPSGGVASAFLADINALRGSAGAGPLGRDGTLDAMAQAWAEQMAADDWLRHSELIHDVVAQGWSAAGENIAYGPDEASMFAGLTNSSGHYANMVNPAYTAIGIGVAVVGPVIWTAHLYAG